MIDNGFKQVPSILEKVASVDKDNMAATVIADGYHKAEELK
jgi:D-xylose transport system substrate-binding protein